MEAELLLLYAKETDQASIDQSPFSIPFLIPILHVRFSLNAIYRINPSRDSLTNLLAFSTL